MKKIFFCLLLGFANFQFVAGQDAWKERADFFEVLNASLLNAQDGKTDTAVIRFNELKSKFSVFYKSALQQPDSKETKFRGNLTLLSEQITLIGIIINRRTYNAEVIFGEYAILHNRLCNVELADDESFVSKSLKKFYEKEEKKYRSKKKEIYLANGWRM